VNKYLHTVASVGFFIHIEAKYNFVFSHCLSQEFVYFSSRFQEAAIFPVNGSKDSVRLTLYSVINFPFVFEFLY